MAAFLQIISYDQLYTLMTESDVSSETFIHLYQCTRHYLPGDIILQ